MNLTEASKQFKIIMIMIGVAAVIYYIVILLVIPGAKKLHKALFPPKNPYQTIYGQLDPLIFEEKLINNETPRYSLNTSSGKLPANKTDRMKVYPFKDIQNSPFLSGKSAEEDAAFLGFQFSDMTSSLKDDIYTWRKLSTGSTLEINLKNRHLKLNTNIPRNTAAYPKGILSDGDARKYAADLFKALRRFDDNLYPIGTINTTFGTIDGNTLVLSPSSRERQVAMVDIYRRIDDHPILGPDPKKGMLHAIIRTPDKKVKTPLNYPVVEGYYSEIETETKSTYPIITYTEAWNAIKENKGVITHIREKDYNPFELYSPLNVDTVLIDNIYLAYYETPEEQSYLQPIYVFEGKYQTRGTEGGEIVLYYPAIRGEWIKRPEPEPTDENQ